MQCLVFKLSITPFNEQLFGILLGGKPQAAGGCVSSYTDPCTAGAEMQVFACLGCPSQSGSDLRQTGGSNSERKEYFNASV